MAQDVVTASGLTNHDSTTQPPPTTTNPEQSKGELDLCILTYFSALWECCYLYTMGVT